MTREQRALFGRTCAMYHHGLTVQLDFGDLPNYLRVMRAEVDLFELVCVQLRSM